MRLHFSFRAIVLSIIKITDKVNLFIWVLTLLSTHCIGHIKMDGFMGKPVHTVGHIISIGWLHTKDFLSLPALDKL